MNRERRRSVVVIVALGLLSACAAQEEPSRIPVGTKLDEGVVTYVHALTETDPKSSGADGAVAGGLLFGPLGAVAGGLASRNDTPVAKITACHVRIETAGSAHKRSRTVGLNRSRYDGASAVCIAVRVGDPVVALQSQNPLLVEWRQAFDGGVLLGWTQP